MLFFNHNIMYLNRLPTYIIVAREFPTYKSMWFIFKSIFVVLKYFITILIAYTTDFTMV